MLVEEVTEVVVNVRMDQADWQTTATRMRNTRRGDRDGSERRVEVGEGDGGGDEGEGDDLLAFWYLTAGTRVSAVIRWIQ
jgi:hypothetical protein